jgi:hypothetical protein
LLGGFGVLATTLLAGALLLQTPADANTSVAEPQGLGADESEL